MEKGFFNGRGVKEKENNANSRTRVTVVPTCSPNVPSNATDTPNTSLETSASVYSTSQDTSSPSVVQIGIPTVGNTRPVSYINVVPTEPITLAGNGVVSFASLVKNEAVTNNVKFRSLDSDKPNNAKAEVKIPKASILDVHSRFRFSLYGYFGFFFFKFASIEGMIGVLKNGPWFIRPAPIILKKWTPNANVLKEDHNSVLIWVRFHDIPIVAFTADGLSVMATKLGNPIMLDSYTSSMCLQSWGRMDYAGAFIDTKADRELNKDMVIVIPKVKDDGEVLYTVRVEYECEPPRCGVCMVFGHNDMLCPKWPTEKPNKQHTNHDGFQHPSFSHAKKVVQDVVGSAFYSSSNTPLVTWINDLKSQMIEEKLVLLDEDGKPLKPSKSTLPSSSNVVSKKVDDLVNEDNDSEVEEVYDETATYMASMSFNVNKASKSDSEEGYKILYEQ
ncbi:reverse transcriptase domain-containing protein [Tanacetum coccineum]|uniref:Reverse transcriptase domain-containing protein n=1 Tax=Tanacetum coccineum TaxID=301880 RepID=A0ABQ5DYP7_9ASTR